MFAQPCRFDNTHVTARGAVRQDLQCAYTVPTDLGQQVAAGQPLSSLHPLFELGSPDARILTAPVPGVIAIRRTNGLVAAGDHLMTIAPEITAEALGQQIA